MKNLKVYFQLILIGILGLSIFYSCNKPRRCHTVEQDTNTNHLVDISPLYEVPGLIDTLNKYPSLQVSRIIDNDIFLGFHSNMYYKELIIFHDGYRLFYSRNDGNLFAMDTLLDTIPIITTPTLSSETAIKTAQIHQDYTYSCIEYRLGIFNKYSGRPLVPEYRLVWRVTGKGGGSPEVILDAHNGGVLFSDDGIRY